MFVYFKPEAENTFTIIDKKVGIGNVIPQRTLDIAGTLRYANGPVKVGDILKAANTGGDVVWGDNTPENWRIPVLNPGWSNLDINNFAAVGYYKDGQERVYLRGLLNTTNSIAAGSTIFTLPAGYRPSTSKTLTFSVSNNDPGVGRINIGADGSVVAVDGTTGWFSLCDISFRAD